MTFEMRRTVAGATALPLLVALAACQGEAPPADQLLAPGDEQITGAAGGAATPFGNADPAETPARVSLPDPSGGPACSASVVAAQPVTVSEELEEEVALRDNTPLALYIMLDKSISMIRSNQWSSAVAALGSFVNDPASAQMDVALQYFPSGGTCANGRGYDTPEVELGRLPEHASVIEASLGREDPYGFGTPIEGALRGATEFCKRFQEAEPEECVAVLVTDGKPEYAPGCEEESAALAAIAADAYTVGVRTFTVGLAGADFALLDQIAMAGGAVDCDPGARFACEGSSGAGELLAALERIRDNVVDSEFRTVVQTRVETRVLDCQWQLPAVADGAPVDASRVNLQLVGDSGVQTLGRVDGAGACAEGGWYFDDAGSPASVIACPATCGALDAEAGGGEVRLLLGCETQTL